MESEYLNSTRRVIAMLIPSLNEIDKELEVILEERKQHRQALNDLVALTNELRSLREEVRKLIVEAYCYGT